ncbi:MAG: hypothetical protein Fur006_69740 [Coleofasciculaceae cyanobacterium]
MSDPNKVNSNNLDQITPTDTTIDGSLFVTGKIGIGTTDPEEKLHLYSPANPTVLRIQSSARFGAGRIEFWSDPQNDNREWRPGYIESTDQDQGTFTGGLAFFVNGTGSTNKTASQEVMRLVNSNVGIGTKNPSGKLEIDGRINNAKVKFGMNIAGYEHHLSSARDLVFNATDGQFHFRKTSYDNLSNYTDLVRITGNGHLWVAGIITQNSSRAVKENIVELSGLEALEALKNINPVKFNYKADSHKNLHVGFIAEDVPDLVATPDKKGLSAMDIVAVLTKALQEQQKTITALAEKVKRLEAQTA